jgi:VIT1/CCC1 family predicted Fe2+/Mn2+ transporter
MGLGGYLAARGDAEHYAHEKLREEREIVEIPDAEKHEVRQLFEAYGLTETEAPPVVDALSQRPKQWVDFMMRFELGLEEPDPRRALTSAATIALAYVAGGFVPRSPYIVLSSAVRGLIGSAIVTLAALGVFGYLKARFTGAPPLRGASQTMVIGGLAAGPTFVIAKLIA